MSDHGTQNDDAKPARTQDQAGQSKAPPTEAPDRLGPSDHVGKPRSYAETAVEKLEDDQSPEASQDGKGQSSGR